MELKFLLLLLLLFGITPNLGFFSFPSFLILISVCVLFVVILFVPKRTLQITTSQKFLPLISIVLLFYSSFYYGGLYQNLFTQTIGMAIMVVFSLVATVRWYFKREPPSIIWSIIIYLFLSLLTLIGSQHPIVDTIVVLKEAPMMVLRGLNPYAERFSAVYPTIDPTYYNYLPASFLFLIPFVYFFNDPRYSTILAMLIISLVICRIAKKSKRRNTASWLVLIILFLPRSFFILEHMYLDPIIVSVFAVFIYFTAMNRKTLSYVFLSFFFLFKQTPWTTFPLFLSPFIIQMTKHSKYVLAFTIPLVFPLYYFFLNPAAFIQDVFTGLSKTSITSPIGSSLTVQTLFLRAGISLGPLYGLILPLIILLIVYVLILWRKPGLYYSIALVVFSFHFFSYHAFFNVYYFVSLFLVLDIASTYTSHI